MLPLKPGRNDWRDPWILHTMLGSLVMNTGCRGTLTSQEHGPLVSRHMIEAGKQG